MKQNRPMIIGLTGGIATGKSTVSRILKAEGIDVIDADEIAREVVSVGSTGLEAVVSCFGQNIVNEDQSLNRTKLGQIVFNDEEKLEQLNNLLHPLIKKRIKELIRELAKKGSEIITIDAALLIEAGWERMVDVIVLVDVDEKIQIERLIKRNNITHEIAKKMIEKQAKREYKQQFADIIITNNGCKEELEQKTMQVLKEMKREING